MRARIYVTRGGGEYIAAVFHDSGKYKRGIFNTMGKAEEYLKQFDAVEAIKIIRDKVSHG